MPPSSKETAGFYGGRHFSAWTDEVNALKRAGQLDEATELLWHLVAATENDSVVNRWGVAPWYYEQLAIIARKRGDLTAEVAVLERYAAARKAPGAAPAKMAERLATARRLLATHRGPVSISCPACGALATPSSTGSSGQCDQCGARFIVS